MRALIITEKYLKEVSVINDNTDMKILTPSILDAQDLYMVPLLGSDLFNELITQVNSQTVTALNQTLLDNYVLPCLVKYTLYESTPAFKYKYMNKGIMVRNSENSSNADLQEIQYMMDWWRNKGQEFAERCTKFLCQEIASYPLFRNNPNYDDIQPNTTNYSGSFYLEDPGDCRPCYRRGHD